MSKKLWISICLLVGLLLAVGLFYSLMDDEDDEEQDEEYRTLTIKLQDYTVTRELTAKDHQDLRRRRRSGEEGAAIDYHRPGSLSGCCEKCRGKGGQCKGTTDYCPSEF